MNRNQRDAGQNDGGLETFYITEEDLS